MSERPLKILVIDDDASVRETLVAYLEDCGYAVGEAENGRTGIDRARRECPDLILCDLKMPEMNGLEVVAVMAEERPETPIIIASGQGSLDDAIGALKLGAWDYITKPIKDMVILEHAIDHALERARLVREVREYRENLEAMNAQLKASLHQLEEDEEAGRRIQFQMLPESRQVYGHYEFTRHLLTSLYLSGDFVDYFVIDPHHLGFYLADVSGHGVSSAFVTVLLKSFMSRYLEAYRQNRDEGILDPAEILRRLNGHFFHGRLGKYLTMFYGVIDKTDNRLRYSNGGQFPYPILFDGREARFIRTKSLPVGLFDFAEYRTETLELPPRFVMAMISDGILETLPQPNLQEKQAFLRAQIDKFAIDVPTLIQLLQLDRTGTLPDDVTLLLIKRIL